MVGHPVRFVLGALGLAVVLLSAGSTVHAAKPATKPLVKQSRWVQRCGKKLRYFDRQCLPKKRAKVSKKALKRLRKQRAKAADALDKAKAGSKELYAARIQLIELELELLASLRVPFKASQKKVRKALAQKLAASNRLKAVAKAILDSAEPAEAACAYKLLGDAYVELAGWIANVPAPRKAYNEVMLQEYREGMAEQARTIANRAAESYGEAVKAIGRSEPTDCSRAAAAMLAEGKR